MDIAAADFWAQAAVLAGVDVTPPKSAVAPPPDITLARAIDAKYPRRKDYGDTYQNGVKPGPAKLEQFKECLALMLTPKLYGNEKGENNNEPTYARVKLFDPTGSATWYLTEFSDIAPDGVPNLAYGLCDLYGNKDEAESGYVSLEELANTKGRMGIGIELDMHWKPRLIKDIYDDNND